ncbi:unnamed protein product [Plutella xylostella]|uniref:(diamondback moth) hypothetical protein n=1 Tax=Plutella xylostella TaxID=51655 RepID=A0A8S4EHA7_PLUXY|nr:unnamed protein product [Plutella xylostella]
MDVEKLRQDASSIQWSDMQDLPSIDDKVAFLCSNVISIFDKHAPVRPVRLKHRPSPWITDTVRKAMAHRDRLFRRFKKDRTDENWSACRAARNRCNKLCRNAKRRFIFEQIELSSPAGQFPNLWLKAYVLPLPKVPAPTAPNEYRPISILPFLSKILESIVHRQLTMFLSNGGLLNPFQSGFRSGHSTTTALLKVTEDIRCAMEDRRVTVLVLVDFSNAFNAVDHDLLLAVLRCHKISDPAVSWFSSYLRGRQQAIRCGPSDISDWADLSAGVPQGGILSPLLFSTFINLVTSNLLCSYHLYADDLQIYNQVKLDDLDAGIAGVNSDLEEILRWSRSFGISVNPNLQSVVGELTPLKILEIMTTLASAGKSSGGTSAGGAEGEPAAASS